LVASGPGYDFSSEGEKPRPCRIPRRAKTPVRRRPYAMTIVWILIVIILVLLVIALARRVL
jgi:hypothetical protein